MTTDEHPLEKIVGAQKFEMSVKGFKGQEMDVPAYTRREYLELLNEMKQWRRRYRQQLDENEQLRVQLAAVLGRINANLPS